MKKITFLSLAFVSLQANAMFCPTNFNQINIGDSIEQVTSVCGVPEDQETAKQETPVPQEWTYYVNPTGSAPGMPVQTSTLKMTVAFGADEKVSNITINAQSLINTTVCNGNPIQVGDNAKKVKSVCGDAQYVNKGQPKQGQPKEVEITIYRYHSTPPATLTFQSGKLISRN